jgi:FeS assembly SUF system protein
MSNEEQTDLGPEGRKVNGAQAAEAGGEQGAGAQPMEASSEQRVNMNAAQPALRDEIEAALRTVFDPEIPVNIYDLGLVYEIKIGDKGDIKITMTLTAPACPVAGEIVRDVQEKIEALSGVLDCHVQLTFDPPWNKEMMSEEAKLELGFL